MVISWPSPSLGFFLQQDTDLSTANWSYFTGPVSDNGTTKSVTITMSPGSLFFRLIHPAPSAITVETAADGSGTVVSPQDIPSGKSITVYAITRDVLGHFVGNPASTWSLTGVTGGVASGDLTPATGPSATFTGHAVGSAAIHVVNGAFNADSGTLTVVPGPIDHYAVSATTPQTGTVAFEVTVTAQDANNNPATTDSSTVVTLSASTANVQFDSNGDSTYGDNTKTLASGTFTIWTRDNVPETITITATDGNGKTGTSNSIDINP
jgi:hypothetical protein